MDHRWIARGLVVALHAAVMLGLWLHRPPRPGEPAQRRFTTVRLIAPSPPTRPPPVMPRPDAPPPPGPRLSAPPAPTPDSPRPADAPAVTAPAPETAAVEPPRSTLRLTLPPGYAASSAAARNPALGDPRSNTRRPTLEDRIADATGGAGAWVEEGTSENRAQAVGALGDRRTVMRRGDTCVEVLRSRIADMDSFNGNVAPRATGMAGKPYKCR